MMVPCSEKPLDGRAARRQNCKVTICDLKDRRLRPSHFEQAINLDLASGRARTKQVRLASGDLANLGVSQHNLSSGE
jgi:hypothetical protein